MSLINGSPTPTAIVLIIILIAVSVGVRIFLWRRYRIARAKCPKCGEVFVPPRTSIFRFGPYSTIKCPACGETSRMHLGTKEPITWPKDEPTEGRPEEKEDLERRIQESKYNK